MSTIIPIEHSILIYRASYFSLVSSLYALYKRQYIISTVPGSVFITSILYWSNPDYSWRRYLDMMVAKTGFIYQLYIAYNAEYSVYYYSLTTLAALCYPIGIYYYNKKDLLTSTYFHIMIHIFGNIANIVMYSGKI